MLIRLKDFFIKKTSIVEYAAYFFLSLIFTLTIFIFKLNSFLIVQKTWFSHFNSHFKKNLPCKYIFHFHTISYLYFALQIFCKFVATFLHDREHLLYFSRSESGCQFDAQISPFLSRHKKQMTRQWVSPVIVEHSSIMKI